MGKILTSLLCVLLLSSCNFIENYKEQKIIDDFEQELDQMFEENESMEENRLIKELSNDDNFEYIQNKNNLITPVIESIYSDEVKLWETNFDKIFYGYYENIISNPEAAYKLKYQPDISLEDFKALYSNTHSISVLHSTLWDDNTYDAEVILKSIDKSWVDVYKVTGQFIENKIQTITTKKLEDKKVITTAVSSWKFRAYIEEYRWDKRLYLEDIEKETRQLIYELIVTDAFESKTRDMYARLYNSGERLVFVESGWEFVRTHIINLDNNAHIQYDGGIWEHWFTKGKKYVYTCLNSGMLEWELKVYTYPDLILTKEVFPGNFGSDDFGLDCSHSQWYNSERDIFQFQFYAGDDNQYELDFSTLEVNKL